MINFFKILIQFGSFKIHLMKIQLSFMILRKISENSVHFSQFQDIFTQKHYKYQSDMFDNMSIIVLTQIHRIFVHFSLFWHRVSFFLFSLIKIMTIRFKNAQKERKANFSIIDMLSNMSL